MKIWSLAAGIFFIAGCAATIAERPSDVTHILTKMKAACGGSAWDRVQGWHETGVAELAAGPSIENEVWHDMRSLKTRMIGRMGGKIVRDAGFDGETYWQAGPDGKGQIASDSAGLRRQRRDTYLSSFGWFFPERFPAEIDLGTPGTHDGTAYQILHITPKDAESFDLWVDPKTHLVRRIVAGEEYAELSEYRTFDGVCSATNGRQGDGDPTHQIVLHVRSVETDKPIAATMFAAPADLDNK